MDNKINNSKLDETVKTALNNYEVPYNPIDWVQMESMLEVAPAHNSLRRSYSPVIVLALVILGGAFLLYIVLKPSEISKKTDRIPTPQIVKIKTKSPEVKPDEKPVLINPVVSAIKTEPKPAVKTVTTHSNTIEPAVPSIKNNAKPTVKPVISNLTNTASVVSPSKNSTKPTLSDNESKSRLFKALQKEALLKKGKALQKETKREENDTVHIDDENDSNKNGQAPKIANELNSVAASDTLKDGKEKPKSRKEIRKSRRDKKTTVNDTLSKNPPSN